jgi:hypothetical protein
MAGISLNVPLPIQDRIARAKRENLPAGQRDELEGTMPDVWVKYFQSQSDLASQAPAVQSNPVSVSTQAASIAATPIPSGTLRAGNYRVSYYARVTRAATVSSTLTVTISWTDGGASCSFSGAAMTGNTTTTVQSGSVFLASDASAPILYSTVYGSVGGTTMQYKLIVALELIP